MNELRTNILIDSEIASSKRRFGLFSQPPPIAIGDDSPAKQTKRFHSHIQILKDKMESLKPILHKCLQVVVSPE